MSTARFVAADARGAVVVAHAAVVDVDAVDARQTARRVRPAGVTVTERRARVVNVLNALAVSCSNRLHVCNYSCCTSLRRNNNLFCL